MSLFGKIFGGKSSSKNEQTTPAQAIQRIRDVEEIMHKKVEFLEKKIDEENEVIRKNNNAKNKRIAIQALKRRKRIEKQLEQADGTLTTLEFQREALENANTNAEVFNVISLSGKALKHAHNDMDIDKVEDLMDEVKEQQQIAEEISAAISNPIGFGQDVDEDELMKELEEMEQEELDKQLLDTQPERLPEVPADKIPIPTPRSRQKDEEQDELKELAEWAN